MHVPVHATNARASCARPCGHFRQALAAANGDPKIKSRSTAARYPFDHSKRDYWRVAIGHREFPGQQAALDLRVPLRCGGSGRDARRGGARDRADSAVGTRMCRQRNTGRGRGLFGRRPKSARPRACFLWVTFLCTSKEKLPARRRRVEALDATKVAQPSAGRVKVLVPASANADLIRPRTSGCPCRPRTAAAIRSGQGATQSRGTRYCASRASSEPGSGT